MVGIIIVLSMVNLIIVFFGKYTKKRLITNLIIDLVLVVLSLIESTKESYWIIITIISILGSIQDTNSLEKMK